MALNLTRTVVDFLAQHPEQKFTAREMANWIFKTFPDECQEKKANSSFIKTDGELVQQLVAEIGSQRIGLQARNTQIKTTEGRPRQYYWTTKSDQVEISEAERKGMAADSGSEQHGKRTALNHDDISVRESELYPRLARFLWTEFRIYPKRIDERKSSNRQGPGANKWLYPDLVGMEDLTSDWHHEIKGVVNQYGDKRTRLSSYEVKVLLNRSNVREAFFQTVSNSSWYNYGYLVTTEIQGTETEKELRMLFSLHGIGLIRLNVEDPSESEILIPARERLEVDWATCNRLVQENRDFLDFIRLVRQFHQTGDARPKDWDLHDVT